MAGCFQPMERNWLRSCNPLLSGIEKSIIKQSIVSNLCFMTWVAAATDLAVKTLCPRASRSNDMQDKITCSSSIIRNVLFSKSVWVVWEESGPLSGIAISNWRRGSNPNFGRETRECRYSLVIKKISNLLFWRGLPGGPFQWLRLNWQDHYRSLKWQSWSRFKAKMLSASKILPSWVSGIKTFKTL